MANIAASVIATQIKPFEFIISSFFRSLFWLRVRAYHNIELKLSFYPKALKAGLSRTDEGWNWLRRASRLQCLPVYIL
jgi:hypothetical protein